MIKEILQQLRQGITLCERRPPKEIKMSFLSRPPLRKQHRKERTLGL